MPIDFQIESNIRILSYCRALLGLILTQAQIVIIAITTSVQKDIIELRMQNMTINSTHLYQSIPFEDCLCSVVSSLKHCFTDQGLKCIRAVPLILFILIVYFIWDSLILSGDRIYLFVYTYWTICFISFFTILFIIYQGYSYYWKMSAVIVTISFIQFVIHIIHLNETGGLRLSNRSY